MDKKFWCHSFAYDAIKRKLLKSYRKPRLSADGLNALPAVQRKSAAEDMSEMHPWMGLFDDPALHEALDRIMASNRIA